MTTLRVKHDTHWSIKWQNEGVNNKPSTYNKKSEHKIQRVVRKAQITIYTVNWA